MFHTFFPICEICHKAMFESGGSFPEYLLCKCDIPK